MNTRQAILYNVTGQTLEMYPPDWAQGAAGAATVSVWRSGQSNDDTPEFTGTATNEATTVSTTVDAASGYSQTDRRKLNVASTSGFVVGRPLVVINADGQVEQVVPRRIVSNDYVESEVPMAYDHGVGATVKGLRQSLTVDATFVATESKINDLESPYRVQWEYTIGGATRRVWTLFDLVRQQPRSGLTANDLYELFPDLSHREWRNTRGQAFAKQIDAAKERLDSDLAMQGLNPNTVRDAQLYDELHRTCTLYLLARAGLHPADRDVEAWKLDWEKQYQTDLINAKTKLLVDQGKEGGITQAPTRQLWFSER